MTHEKGLLKTLKGSGREQKKEKRLDKVNVAEVDSDFNVDILTISIIIKYLSETWIMDSGCLYHMFPYREWFDTYQPYNDRTVLMENDVTYKLLIFVPLKLKCTRVWWELSLMLDICLN